MIGITCVLTAAFLTAAGDYTITVDSFGLGNTWRAGEITPLHITVSNTIPEPISAWISWDVPDGDGDVVAWGRPITLTPNQDVSTWLYAPVQPWANGTTPWTLRLRTLVDGIPSEQLTAFRFSPQSVNAAPLSLRHGAIAVVGTRRVGLGGLAGAGKAVTVLEPTTTISGLQPEDLPDAWPCFDSIDTLVWADAPPELDYRQAKAIEEWVSRGGHLVIILPTIGNPWALGSQEGPLASILSDIQPTLGNAEISDFKHVLGNPRNYSPLTLTVRSFDAHKHTPLFTLQDSRVIAITKDYGVGMCSIIGVDLSDGRLAAIGLPRADVFWNRILGRRGDTPSPTALQKLDDLELLSGTIPTSTTLPMGAIAAQTIAMSTTAGGRLGTVFVLVLSYIIVGGPIGYFILRKKKKLRWSWMWFATTSLVFTAITWILAQTTSSVTTPLRHLSIIDQVYGAPRQQVHGWFSLYLPNYSNNQISIGGSANLLMPWTPSELSKAPSFADTRHVSMNVDQVPSYFDQPSRATTSNFQFNWAGGLQSDTYQSLIRVGLDEGPSVRTLENGTPIGLSGLIFNKMNISLFDVTVVWITDNKITPALHAKDNAGNDLPWIKMSESGKPLNVAYSWRLSQTWDPEESLSLHRFEPTVDAKLAFGFDERYKQENRWDAYGNGAAMPSDEIAKRLEMLSLYSHLKPPVYRKREGSKKSPPSNTMIREGGRELDMASWFGRPCIIIMGFVKNASIPVPIEVDGEEISKSDGMTMVRWVYPLGITQ
ncbi:MAG: hypothetical protein HOC93_02400 [Phycisphaerae bacterium]|jgi:hypothetical protein|nr:hypothetical protein [Phycisphaerae bacterium]